MKKETEENRQQNRRQTKKCKNRLDKRVAGDTNM